MTFVDVQSYLLFCDAPDFSRIRPQVCQACGYNGTLHGHGVYKRTVWGPDGGAVIPIFRFRCPACGYTTGVLPSFIGRYERCSWDTQEEALATAEKASLEQAAEMFPPPCGPLSPRTLWRWRKRCRLWMDELDERFWRFVITTAPWLEMQRGANRLASKMARWRQIWQSVSTTSVGVGFLHGLYRLRHAVVLLAT